MKNIKELFLSAKNRLNGEILAGYSNEIKGFLKPICLGIVLLIPSVWGLFNHTLAIIVLSAILSVLSGSTVLFSLLCIFDIRKSKKMYQQNIIANRSYEQMELKNHRLNNQEIQTLIDLGYGKKVIVAIEKYGHVNFLDLLKWHDGEYQEKIERIEENFKSNQEESKRQEQLNKEKNLEIFKETTGIILEDPPKKHYLQGYL